MAMLDYIHLFIKTFYDFPLKSMQHNGIDA